MELGIKYQGKSATQQEIDFIRDYISSQYVGKTTGRGKNDQTNKVNRSIKAVWCYPVTRKFREQLKTSA